MSLQAKQPTNLSRQVCPSGTTLRAQPIAPPSHPSLGTLRDLLCTGKDSPAWVHTNGRPHRPSCRIDA